MMAENAAVKLIIENRRARHEYHILETYETGIELVGTEVKSLRNHRANLQDAFARIENGQIYLYSLHISPYEMGNRFNHDPLRPRRLLLHKSEIARLFSKVREKGLTLIPLRMYFSGSLAKVEIGLAQGKKLYDKRQDMAERESKRDVERAFKERGRI